MIWSKLIKLFALVLFSLQVPFLCPAQTNSGDRIVLSETFELVPVTANTWMHVSEEEHPHFGKFTCNGLLYINQNEAVICDSPPTEKQAELLLNWLSENKNNVTVKAVLVNHFHSDCLGGLAVFHKAGIASYSYELTPTLLPDSLKILAPHNTFSGNLKLKTGAAKAEAQYAGQAHTKDNIVVWFPEEKVLFGGCMVKSMGSGKGNLADANTKEWAATVRKVKQQFPDANVVIPGHGKPGGPELLDYTIKMFSKKSKYIYVNSILNNT